MGEFFTKFHPSNNAIIFLGIYARNMKPCFISSNTKWISNQDLLIDHWFMTKQKYNAMAKS